VCLIIYFCTKSVPGRNAVLLFFSLVFYAWGEPVGIWILIASAFASYRCALALNKNKGQPSEKVILAVSIVLALVPLILFKYTGFFTENINALFSVNIPVPNIRLPIGISFYTFQIISYNIDCYWGEVKPQRAFGNFLMYVSLFPQLVAGPIVRYGVIAEEIKSRQTTAADLDTGLTRLVTGLAKKVILANGLSVIVDELFINGDIKTLTVVGTWYAVIAYALQIYFDFSGYSDMAIGLGRILGFHFDENFNHPFICKDITEFWQRWHISLGSFFRDYLFYVETFGKIRPYFNLILVWFCTGIWHGASWNYIFWGLYFGLFILLETKIGKKKMKKIPIIWRHIYNKTVIVIGFGIFCFEDLGQLGNFFKNLIFLNGNAFIDELTVIHISNNLFLMIASVLFCFPVLKLFKRNSRYEYSSKFWSFVRIAVNVILLAVSSVLLVNNTNNPFMYFRF
jgi:alginate O-acetyltransferase complex protein AlgI